jgi:hypothetical protein
LAVAGTLAVTVQDPVLIKETLEPDTVQTAAVEEAKVGVPPLVEVALNV